MWEAMDGRPAAWRVVFKSLTLLEHLVKNGTDRIIEDARGRGHKLRSLYNFNYFEGTTDRGIGVREKSKQIMEILQDNDRVREERQKARQLREKFGGGLGMSAVGSNGNNGGRYEGYGNDSSSSSFQSKNNGGYGNGGLDARNTSSSRGFSGRYSDDSSRSNSNNIQSIPKEEDATPTFAQLPEVKKVKKTKKKKKAVIAAPPAAAAAPEVDLFSFDAPAPAAPVEEAAASFDAFQTAATPTSATPTADVQFDAFSSAPATFDAFAGSALAPIQQSQPMMTSQMSNGMAMMNQQQQMMMNATAVPVKVNNGIMGGGKRQTVSTTAQQQKQDDSFGNFSSAAAAKEDDFGDFAGSNNHGTKSAADPMSRLIALDSLTPNANTGANLANAPVPAPTGYSNSFQMPTAMTSPNYNAFGSPAAAVATSKPAGRSAEAAFSGLDGLTSSSSSSGANLMMQTSVGQMQMLKSNGMNNSGGQSVMMQSSGPTAVDKMSMAMQQQQQQQQSMNPMGGMNMNMNMNQMTPQQMMYAQQMMMAQQQQQKQMMMQGGGGMNMQNMMSMGPMGGSDGSGNNMMGGQMMGGGQNGFR